MRVPSVSDGCGAPTRLSHKQTAARHIGSMKQPGLAWVARQMRRQAASAVAWEPRPSRVPPLQPRSEHRHSTAVETESTEGSDAVRCVYSSGARGFQNAPDEPKRERPPVSREIRHDSHVQRFDGRSGGDQVDTVDIPSGRQSSPGYGDRSNGHVRSELASRVDSFGWMAPCWRLIESAQAYMDKDQFEYMRALLLSQARKPMSREQLLERAEGCLQEQDEIFAAFVKMFDLISRPPEDSRYPTERPPHPIPQSTSYGGRRLPDTYPIHVSVHEFHPTQASPPRTRSNGGEGGCFVSSYYQPHTPVNVPTNGCVGVRRSTYPVDHAGACGW